MKQLFIIIPIAFLLFCDTPAQAKVKKAAADHRQQLINSNTQLVRAIERRQAAHLNAQAAAKTTGTSERLIATSVYNLSDSIFNELGIIDSEAYTYSGNRSSSFDFDAMLYYPTFILDDTYPLILGGNLNIFNESGTPDVLFDTCRIWEQLALSGEPFSYQGMNIANYDANNNLLQYYGPYTTDPNMEYYENRLINTYDADQHLASSLTLSWDYGVWDTSELRLLSYNGNMITKDSTSQYMGNGQWMPEEKLSYAYNNIGNITNATFYYDSMGVWLTNAKYFIFYNTDNTFQKDSASQNTNGIWLPFTDDSVGYTPGINYVTYERSNSYDENSGELDAYTEFTKHFTGSLPDAFYINEYDYFAGQIAYAEKESFDYDSYNNPVLSNTYTYDSYNGTYYDTPNYISHYYYQQYTTTAVNNVVKQNVNVTVYPNPATDEINILQTGIQQGTRTYITLINALGQTVHSENLPWMSSTETISLGGLVPGNYWLVIQDKGGNILSRQAIVKK